MGFEEVVMGEVGKKSFGSQRYIATGKERPHISDSKLSARDDAERIGVGESKLLRYEGWRSRRYLAFAGLSYDVMVSLYDVNSPAAYAARVFQMKGLMPAVKAGLRRLGTSNTNLEARVIGLQNKEDHAFLNGLLALFSREGIRLIEADLFGDEIRHVAIDLKTGASFNILLEDRHYRPGELTNTMTLDDFSRTMVKPEK